MNTTNLFKIALKAIASNKLRSFLTALGIIIGVASVIAMLAIGQGSKRSIRKQISEMGSNMIMIHPGADMRGGVRLDADEMQTLKLEDYESIRNEAKYLTAVSPSVNSAGQFIYGNNNAPSSIYGVNEDYLTIQQRKVADGEFFTEQDIKTAAKVCVLGQTVVDNLFPDGSSPIGRVVRFNSIPFRVVGVLKSKGYNSWGMDQDDMALAPYTTVMKRILAVTYLQGINCSAVTEDATDMAIEEITEILRKNHNLKEETETTEADVDDFTSFKVQARRNHTDFEVGSMDMNRIIGAALCEAHPEKKVQMKNPDVVVGVEVVQNAAYVYARSVRGQGGLPAFKRHRLPGGHVAHGAPRRRVHRRPFFGPSANVRHQRVPGRRYRARAGEDRLHCTRVRGAVRRLPA